MSEADLHEMMRDPRYWRDRDPEFIRRVTDGFRHLFADAGGDETTDPAAEIAALRARVAELEAEVRTCRSLIYGQDESYRALEASRTRLVSWWGQPFMRGYWQVESVARQWRYLGPVQPWSPPNAP